MNFDFSKIGIEKNIPKVNFTDYSGLLIAEPKFGKTTMASMYPKAIIMPFEKGYQATVSNVFKKLNSWDDFIEFIDNLEDNREEIGDQIVTLVFDTANEAYAMCEPYTLRRLSHIDGKHYTTPKEVPHGQFYSEHDKDFKLQIQRIFDLGFLPLFITHAEVKTITPKDGEPYQVYSNTMPDRLQKIINPLVSYIIYGQRTFIDDGNGNKIPKRIIMTKANEMTTAGSRVRLDHNIIFDTEQEAMEKFQKAFKESVQKTLKEAGIDTDIDELSRQQAEEKNKELKERLEKKKEDLPTLITKIKKEIKDRMTAGMTVKDVMDILGKFDLKSPDNITDFKVAQEVLEAFK